MSPDWRNALRATLVLLVISASASAEPGYRLQWAFQDTGILSLGSGQTSLAMKPGLAWPIIFNYGPAGSAYTLAPSGGKPATWQPLGAQSSFQVAPPMRTASSPDGRIAVFGTLTPGGASIYSSTAGWSPLPSDTLAVAFDKTGNLLTATRDGIAGLPQYSGSAILDMTISPAGDIGILDLSRRYWHYSSQAGQWLSTYIGVTDTFEDRADSFDLEFDALGRPHIVAGVGFGASSKVYACDFSTITGTWQTTRLTSAVASHQLCLTLAANSQREVATAWIEGTGNLMFSYKPDNGDWLTSLVATDARSSLQLGLAFDGADRPVISYIGNNGHIKLAYSPAIVPEPASLTLLTLTGLIALRRNRAM